jgi:hypothetical protein
MWRRDFMSARDPAEAAEVLDLLLKFFGDGERWVKGRLSDRRGNRCLVGALDFVSSHHARPCCMDRSFGGEECTV